MDRQFRAPVLLRRIAQRPGRVCLALAAAFVLARVALLPVRPAPEPRIHDEFAYLLGADTFAHGYASAPPPEHPVAFESPHVLVTPRYASKYPPGQSFVLAIGQALAGHPYAGVLLSVAALLALLTWAAYAWLPPQWALLTGVTGWLLLFVRHYWSESYWGGAVAACGGALVLGGLGHVLRGNAGGARFAMGSGALILWFTRPFEGAVLCAGVAAILCYRFCAVPAERRPLLRGAAVTLAIAAVAVPLTLWHNQAITGNAARLPYALHNQQYSMMPPLWLLSAQEGPRHYPNATITATFEKAWGEYHALRSASWPRRIAKHGLRIAMYNQWPQFGWFLLLLAMLPWARAGNRKRWLVALLGLGTAMLFAEVWLFPHYTAPFLAAELIAMVVCARSLWYRLGAAPRWRWTLIPVSLALLLPLLGEYVFAFPVAENRRAELVRELSAQPGRHLVFVDYVPGWNHEEEWVYNLFDYAEGKILFAHALTADDDRQVAEAYPGRFVWRVTLGPKAQDVRVERQLSAPSATTVIRR